ncbi:MAG: hypothetical protein WBG69_01075 [Arcobacteraceae bacterium]
MNINTNTLLNAMLNKIDPTIKSKIEKLSVDGKVDLSSLVKDKGIQTLLANMFQDIATGVKSKSDVATLVETGKNSLKFKNISTDLKQILHALKTELPQTPQLEKLTTLLKNTLVDINTINQKVVKNSIENSGVFLESKLAQPNLSVKENLTKLVTLLNEKLTILNNILKEPITQQKIPSIQIEQQSQSQTQQSKVDTAISSNVQLQNKVTDILTTTKEIKPEVKLELQKDIQNILKKIESTQNPEQKIQIKLDILKNVTGDIKNLEQKILTFDIKNDIATNLKDAVVNLKNNFLSNAFFNINKTVILIKEQLSNINLTNLDELKSEIKNIETKLQTFPNDKNVETKIVILKELVTQSTKLLEKVNGSNIQELLKNNIGNTKNIMGDLKTILLQVKEQVENPTTQDSVSKELKINIDKALSQIDYYQLSSFSSNSNHSFISFLQDELEDVDIKFNNANEDEFSCLINLALKENGELKILLVLDKKNGLNINIGVEKEEFKNSIQTQLQKLRKQINSIGLSLLSLNLFDLEKENKKSNSLKAYGNNQNLDFGLDIKV